MKAQSANLRNLTKLALLLALEIVMAFTPLGMLQIPPVSLTIMHIPVIIGGILMGWKAGAFLGGAFGVLSIIRSTFAAAGPVDMAFNPALSGNPLGSLVMAIVPRVLLGVTAALVYRLVLKLGGGRQTVSLIAASVAACLVHSFGVLWLLSTFFSLLTLKEVFEAIIAFNGIIELAVAVVASVAVCRAVLAAREKTA